MSNSSDNKSRLAFIARRYCLPLSEADLSRYVPRPRLEQKLLSAVKEAESKNSIVFVYGIGGSGKTTLINKILCDLEKGIEFREGNVVEKIRAITAVVKIIPEKERFTSYGSRIFHTDEDVLKWLITNIYRSLSIKRSVREIISPLIQHIVATLLGIHDILKPIKDLKEFKEVFQRIEEVKPILDQISGAKTMACLLYTSPSPRD